MVEISSIRHETHCEHCGTPITNVFIIRDEEKDFLIRVGSTCVRSVLAITEKGQSYLEKEVLKAQKHIKHKERIQKALASGDREKLIKSFGKIFWQQDPNATLEEVAERWIEILQLRFDSRIEEIADMYKNAKIRSSINQPIAK